MKIVEVWQPVPAVPDLDASSLGRIRRGSGKIYSQKLSTKGYALVALKRNGVQRSFHVNRLISAAFHGPAPSPDHQAAHLDGVRTNNAAANLKWKTPAENAADKLVHGTHLRGERNPSARLTEEQVIGIYSAAKRGASLAGLAAAYSISEKTARNIRDQRQWGWLTASVYGTD